MTLLVNPVEETATNRDSWGDQQTLRHVLVDAAAL